MLKNYYKLCIKLTLLLIQLTGAFENTTAGACKSLISSAGTTYTCRNGNKTLANCINPVEGTEVFISCNQFYEESNLESNQSRACTKNGWDSLPPECYAICGLKTTTNVSNNSSVLLNYPWHVGIYNSTKHFLCGGTIIEMNIILTAASCVAYYVGNNSDHTLLVASGKYFNGYDDHRDTFAQFSEVGSIRVPDEYKGRVNLFEFNIAILILRTPFVPSIVVKPVCVDLHRLPHHVYFGDDGIVPGWGSSYNGNRNVFSGALKEIKVLYIDNKNCSRKIQEKFIKYLTPDKICVANFNNEISACNGDNGGGLVYENARTRRFYIRGVVSWTPTTDEDSLVCDPNQFSLSTSVASHRNFIRNYTEINQTIHDCHLPDFPPQGKYVLSIPSDINVSLSERTYTAGNPVPPYSELTLICNLGNNTGILRSTQFYCAKYGHWNPTLGGCASTYTTQQPRLPLEASSSQEQSGFNYMYVILIVAIVVLVVIALVAVIVLRVKFKKERELRRDMKLTGLNKFQYGDLKKFNPELGIGAQAELLPYNYNYEFPMDKLELGKQLGSGAFGVVLNAYAYGINSNEEKTRVAVKTFKDIDDNIQLKSLISELKIMIHLGLHLNVVNLLGACTQDISKRKLYVIVEYCQYGNLCNYLLRNRPNYKDQIDSITGNIDYSFGSENLENRSNISRSESLKSSQSNTHFKRSWSESKFKYSRKSKNNIKPLYTKDLISWSFQVARGMDYLSSKMIIHGDLAARNILLTDNNVVKISDFGLAKRIYHTSNYKTSKDCPLPFKWMAVESIRDLVFSTHSDVWSYGIVLWEIFSLAQTPYPGMEADEKLYNKLLTGYKMDSPKYAPKEIYKIMCDCWNMDPTMRPSFNKLASLVGVLLEENVRQHYIDLNDPYLVINTERLKAGQKDYLKMLSQESYQQTSFPNNYINFQKHGSSRTPEDKQGKISTEEKNDSYVESVHM